MTGHLPVMLAEVLATLAPREASPPPAAKRSSPAR